MSSLAAYSKAPAGVAGWGWLHIAALAKALQLGEQATLTSTAELRFARASGDRVTIEMASGARATASALGEYVARRLAPSARVAQAMNVVSALKRAVAVAWDTAALAGTSPACPAVSPVPATVPKGVAYQPKTTPGDDFQQEGWQCLRFSIVSTPIHYQYDVRQRGPYKGPKRGGPDPGPNGFEVSAEGDLDGDGTTSLFTLTGKVANGDIEWADAPFVDQERE